MENIVIDFTKTSGVIKPMNAVNNGPTDPGVRKTKNNFEAYKAARIPFARNHDASFYTPYGGEHIVDVHRIFKNFDADENDPENYIFEPTDIYINKTLEAGTKIFYRLGASIEHRYKYGTRVPKDYEKWARICEHIIMHYNEGWANGFNLGIEYWEIWNEPDCNACWQGTGDEFIDFYEVAAKYLKKCFPKLKIGGPAMSDVRRTEFRRKFLKEIKSRNTPFDFYSYHWYGIGLEDFASALKCAQSELSLAGLDGTPTILNEWNYIKGWSGDDWEYSLATEKNLKGASFVAGAMCVAQAGPIDMLMYYDARPCGMNGLFAERTFELLKPYYSFAMFSDIVEMGEYVSTNCSQNHIYSCAAKGAESAGVMLTYFDDNDNASSKDVKISATNPFPEKNVRVEYRLLDEAHNNELVKDEYFCTDSFELRLGMNLYSTYFINITEV